MAYQKTAPSRASYVTPSDTIDIIRAGSKQASGAGASVTEAGGEIADVVLDANNLGYGYITAPAVTVTDGTGVDATLEAVLDEFGQVASITVLTPGTGYTGPFTVAVSGGTFDKAQSCVLYLGAGGAGKTIKVTTEGGDIIKFVAPEAGTVLGGPCPINVIKVWNTDTTSDYDTEGALIAMW